MTQPLGALYDVATFPVKTAEFIGTVVKALMLMLS